jgi:hypothetical protein
MLPPKSRVLPEYQASMVLPFLLRVFTQPVGVDDLPVEHDVGPALVVAAGQRVVQVGGAGGEHADGLVEVAVGGGLGDPQAPAGQRDFAALPEPHQREHRVVGAAQRPGPGPGAAGEALGGEQLGYERHQLAGHIEHDRIGDHVEPFA